jgi:nucleoid-associated protein YgaU
MAWLTSMFRYLVGVTLVAGGVTLAAPFAVRLSTLVEAEVRAGKAGAERVPPVAEPGLTSAGALAVPVAMTHPSEAAAPAFNSQPALPPAAAAAPEWPAAAWQTETEGAPAPPLQADYQPPIPPAPLPPRPPEFAQPQPAMQGMYRSALDAPPPPLLDPQRPPPLAAGWSGSGHTASRPPAPPAAAGSPLPATYRVRDGDDLAGIAARMYGHPAAAAAIWAANRDLISDPSLLPIGAELRLPPPWEIDIASRSAGGAAIEPRRGPAATPVAAAVGGRIRVAPGDTLAAMAQRLYGDPAMARRIWELNRDQLRSPELVVPGMELRLPPLPQ